MMFDNCTGSGLVDTERSTMVASWLTVCVIFDKGEHIQVDKDTYRWTRFVHSHSVSEIDSVPNFKETVQKKPLHPYRQKEKKNPQRPSTA